MDILISSYKKKNFSEEKGKIRFWGLILWSENSRGQENFVEVLKKEKSLVKDVLREIGRVHGMGRGNDKKGLPDVWAGALVQKLRTDQ